MYECAGLCRELKVAGIYYRVDQRRRQSGGRGIGERYEIGVPEADYERAKAITGGVEPNIVGEVEDPEIVESLDDGVDSGSASPTTRVREGDWHREDATSLAWEGEPADSRHMIEMSLKENDIPMRWDTQDGKSQLFVLPEDEEHAKEIVQEILEGQPPE